MMTMDLKAFVEATLVQIIEGVQGAQASTEGTGAEINPKPGPGFKGNRMFRDGPRIQDVEFDVAVTVAESEEKKGGFGLVVGPVALGGGGKTDAQSSSLNRIRFAVPITLPRPKPVDVEQTSG